MSNLDTDCLVLYIDTMKKQHRKALEQVDRLNPGLHWTKVEALLRSLASDVKEGHGSTLTFTIQGRPFTVDRPHPQNECGLGLVKRVRGRMREIGEL